MGETGTTRVLRTTRYLAAGVAVAVTQRQTMNKCAAKLAQAHTFKVLSQLPVQSAMPSLLTPKQLTRFS